MALKVGKRGLLVMAIMGIAMGSGAKESQAMKRKPAQLDKRAQAIVDEYIHTYKPLDIELRKAWFRYTSTGDKQASKRQSEMELAIRTLQSDPHRFASLKELYAARNDIADSILRREIELLYLGHLENQVPQEKLTQLTNLERQVAEAFNDYRPVVDGKRLTPVDVKHILHDSTESARLEKVWKAQAKVGGIVEAKYRELVELRNEIARTLGFRNYIELSATTMEFNLKDLHRFYADITSLTEKPFRKLKEEYIDPKLAQRYGIEPAKLRPWHYQDPFFQEAPPAVFDGVNLDGFYTKSNAHDVIARTIAFYGSMGIDISEIVKRSSLFPKEGKNPHAVAWLLNPEKPGTSLMSMNMPRPPEHPKADEVSTLVHELSHDINYEAIMNNHELPYLLREPTMLTEAVAMLFENQARTKEWFMSFGASPDRATTAVEGVELVDYVDQLIFLRWSSTIFCFETQLYADPTQDIGDLWWQCKEKYQLEKRPEGWKNPDALAKYHIVNVAPLQYSNYAIGRVANVQFAELLARHIGQHPRNASYFGQKELGAWLMSDFLAAGEKYRWDEFIKHSTGKPLSVQSWKKFYLDAGLEKRLFHD